MKNVIVSIAPSAEVTATGNGAAVDVTPYIGKGLLHLDSSATDAAGKTLNVKIQHSADGTTNWTDTGIAFDQVDDTAASRQTIEVDVDGFKAYIRAVDTMAGATPTVIRSVVLVAKPRAS